MCKNLNFFFVKLTPLPGVWSPCRSALLFSNVRSSNKIIRAVAMVIAVVVRFERRYDSMWIICTAVAVAATLCCRRANWRPRDIDWGWTTNCKKGYLIDFVSINSFFFCIHLWEVSLRLSIVELLGSFRLFKVVDGWAMSEYWTICTVWCWFAWLSDSSLIENIHTEIRRDFSCELCGSRYKSVGEEMRKKKIANVQCNKIPAICA